MKTCHQTVNVNAKLSDALCHLHIPYAPTSILGPTWHRVRMCAVAYVNGLVIKLGIACFTEVATMVATARFAAPNAGPQAL